MDIRYTLYIRIYINIYIYIIDMIRVNMINYIIYLPQVDESWSFTKINVCLKPFIIYIYLFICMHIDLYALFM